MAIPRLPLCSSASSFCSCGWEAAGTSGSSRLGPDGDFHHGIDDMGSGHHSAHTKPMKKAMASHTKTEQITIVGPTWKPTEPDGDQPSNEPSTAEGNEDHE